MQDSNELNLLLNAEHWKKIDAKNKGKQFETVENTECDASFRELEKKKPLLEINMVRKL